DTHPTAQFIEDNIDDYTDDDNPDTTVSGMAFCDSDDDCTIATSGASTVTTGYCTDGRCECVSDSWTGPRCTSVADSSDGSDLYGPPLYLSAIIAAVAAVALGISIVYTTLMAKKQSVKARVHEAKMQQEKETDAAGTKEVEGGSFVSTGETGASKYGKVNYSTNFV
ncbi:hypothetical protein BBJ28_00021857, partial [Nothophytophthora sp. Chile5]